MASLILFCAEKYTNDQAGYEKALSMGNDITTVKVDNGECSYGFMYNVSGAVNAMQEFTGKSVHLGAVRNGIYVSVNEMDEIASSDEMSKSWDCLDSGFDFVIEDRKAKNSAENTVFLNLAINTFKKFSLEIPNLTFLQFVDIGQLLNSLEQDSIKYDIKNHEFNGDFIGNHTITKQEVSIPKPVDT